MKSWKREAEIWKVWLILCKFNIRQVYNRRISNSKISNALVGVDRKDLMRKLSKFIYEEEKALEIHYILQEVRFTEPELFKYMMSQFIAEFSSATISYLQSEEELSRLQD
ncbi:uncharacterized protein [Malus domestica]|uniref:uncharacterized protein isoform X4 n=1 Tax=Malus domestica TaxID=3750 RepID=UPI003976FF04